MSHRNVESTQGFALVAESRHGRPDHAQRAEQDLATEAIVRPLPLKPLTETPWLWGTIERSIGDSQLDRHLAAPQTQFTTCRHKLGDPLRVSEIDQALIRVRIDARLL